MQDTLNLKQGIISEGLRIPLGSDPFFCSVFMTSGSNTN